jgi:hypothetical protein
LLNKPLPNIIAVLCVVSAFIVYLHTLAPTVWFIDSGELAAVASTLGIAHPTGYPLFTVIGHLFTLLPFSNSEVYRLNLMSAFFSCLAVFFFFKVLLLVFSSTENNKAKLGADIPFSKVIVYLIAFSASLIFAYSRTFWNSSNSVEVYPLHSFLIIAVCFVFLKAIQVNETDDNVSFIITNRYYLVFAFLLGLSFTNHLTTILIVPACAIIFLLKNLRYKKSLLRLITIMGVCFLIGLSLYLYLPIRANASPDFIWGDPYNLKRFIWHVTGKQFSVWIFSAKGSLVSFLILMTSVTGLSVYGLLKAKTLPEYIHFMFFVIISVLGYVVISSSDALVKSQFVKFSSSLWNEYGSGIFLLAIAGIYSLSLSNKHIYYFTVISFFSCIFYSINYDIHDIFSYFLLAYMMIALWIGYGIYYFYRKFLHRRIETTAIGIIIAAITLSIPLVPLKTNFTANDESKNYYVEEMTMNIFRNIEPNGIVISAQWDFWVSASWYYNFVKNIRRDIVVIDKELLRRSWYFKYLEKHYPDVYNNSRKEIESFMNELYKFENDLPYNTVTIMKAFENMLSSFVRNNPGRRVYTSWEIEQNKSESFAAEYARIPDGLLFRLVHMDSLDNIDYKTYDFEFTPVTKNDYYHETLMNTYTMMLTASSKYLLSRNRTVEAGKYLELALLASPGDKTAVELKSKYGL